jgi:hypothetical protein
MIDGILGFGDTRHVELLNLFESFSFLQFDRSQIEAHVGFPGRGRKPARQLGIMRRSCPSNVFWIGATLFDTSF